MCLWLLRSICSLLQLIGRWLWLVNSCNSSIVVIVFFIIIWLCLTRIGTTELTNLIVEFGIESGLDFPI